METAVCKTAWGWIGIATTDRGVSAVVLPKPRRATVVQELRTMTGVLPARVRSNGSHRTPPSSRYLEAARAAIVDYIEGRRNDLDLPLDVSLYPRFRRKVWELLRTIPYGRVRSYGWVARKLGRPNAARAVGGACGANPVPLLVPCHRVVAGDGSLGGFSGGLSVKRRLLRLEGILPKRGPRTQRAAARNEAGRIAPGRGGERTSAVRA